MPYAQIDEHFADHPKVVGLSDPAFRLHLAGILYCSRLLTDGLIDGAEVPRLVRRYRKTSLAELVERNLWISLMDGAAYEIRDYLDWNPSREVVLRRRQARAENGAKGGRKPRVQPSSEPSS